MSNSLERTLAAEAYLGITTEEIARLRENEGHYIDPQKWAVVQQELARLRRIKEAASDPDLYSMSGEVSAPALQRLKALVTDKSEEAHDDNG